MVGKKVRYTDWDKKKGDDKLVNKIYIQKVVKQWGQQIGVKELRGIGEKGSRNGVNTLFII